MLPFLPWQLWLEVLKQLWQLFREGKGAAAAAVGLVEGVHAEPGQDHKVAVLVLTAVIESIETAVTAITGG